MTKLNVTTCVINFSLIKCNCSKIFLKVNFTCCNAVLVIGVTCHSRLVNYISFIQRSYRGLISATQILLTSFVFVTFLSLSLKSAESRLVGGLWTFHEWDVTLSPSLEITCANIRCKCRSNSYRNKAGFIDFSTMYELYFALIWLSSRAHG